MLQTMFNYTVAPKDGGVFKRVTRSLTRRVVKSFGFRPVAYSVDGVEILFPASHQTPHTWVYDSDNSKSLGRVAKIIAGKYKSEIFVDIGANIGDSSAIIRSQGVKNKIIAIEGVEKFYNFLKLNGPRLSNIVPVKCFIGTDNRKENVEIMFYDSGNAVVGDFKSSEVGGVENQYLTFERLDTLLSRIAPGEGVKLIKTDIEGFDIPVILSSMDIIIDNFPILYFELHVNDRDEIDKGCGYKDLIKNLKRANYKFLILWRNSTEITSFIDLDNDKEVEVAIEHYRNRHGLLYADACVVHESDADLAFQIIDGELSNSRSLRGS